MAGGGRGHLRKRGRVWYVVLEVDPHPDGRRRQRWVSTGKTRKAEAEEERTRLLRERDTGTDLDPSSVTVAAFLDRWLTDIVARKVEPSTRDQYEATCRRYIAPALGAVRLQQLQAVQLDALYTALLARGLADSTVRDAHTIVHSACEQARRWGLLVANPADLATPPREAYQAPPLWDAASLAAFLEVVEAHRHGAIFLTALGTGMRLGECLGLHWRDVNLDGAKLSVRLQVSRAQGRGHYLKPPKGKRGRLITLDQDTVAVLRAHGDRQRLAIRRAGVAFVDQGLVFPRPDGSLMRLNSLDSAWRRAVRRWGLPHMTFHGLRHLHATLLLLKGIPTKIVSERLGHAKTSITDDIYSHVTPDMQESAALGIAEALGEIRRRGERAREEDAGEGADRAV